MAKSEKLPPIHSGEILREDFMVPLGLSMNKLALDLHVPVTRIASVERFFNISLPCSTFTQGPEASFSRHLRLDAQ
jgi:hypothetical protein